MPAAQAYAPPGFWGPWVDLQGWSSTTHNIRYTFVTESQMPSAFSVEIQYVDQPGPKTIHATGPGDCMIHGGGAGIDRIRCKSFSTGQNVIVTWD
ncbi:hypothetical protein EAE91_07820 [Photorhabdus noenieputensis]|uniref:Uncharacterized protein n=1 Tax=Photorhabdus aegyptia TaxID=2805098 RepID=A0A022PKN3_9GAMM|nr:MULTISPECIES: colicin Z C-terminal domain-related protein [Photorhabdus]EYU16682.1 hypothetical protein BA1DRAFT_00784 [Photorhabdus aegyptia]MBS9437084.1 hypothetical protein [Photorhabdus noenieputensis]MCK3670354.1 hypothetical protein [Photorhabdus noenieputensis]MCW7762795.1 hypothetical protein [Photorhabdus luminescens subsp. venezuelensis]